MAKDWERNKLVVHPIWDSGYQRYDVPIGEVIEKIKEAGYNLDDLREEIYEEDIIDDSVHYELEIHSQRGVIVSPDLALILQPRVYKNGEDITALADTKYFKWVRSSSDPTADAEWNLRHATGIKDLYVTHEDVKIRAVFHCAFLTGVEETTFVSNMYAAYMASINKK